jgi:hypothetical protein
MADVMVSLADLGVNPLSRPSTTITTTPTTAPHKHPKRMTVVDKGVVDYGRSGSALKRKCIYL